MKTWIWLAMLMAAGLLQAPGAIAKDKAPRPEPADYFRTLLQQDGFVVQQGLTDSMNWADEYCAGKIPAGGYVNKADYVRVRVPKSPDDGTLVEVLQLRPDEAIVMVGVTPPAVNYFGYHAFLWSKTYPDSPRKPMFATLGDAVNNATIRTLGSGPFDSPVAMIFTPDRTTDARIRAALLRAGYPAAIINTVVFPAPMLNLGVGEDFDELRVVMRVGKWKDPDAGRFYMENLSGLIDVFRVSPATPAVPDPFPVPALRVRGTGKTEMDLRNKLDQLRQGIIDAHPGLYAKDIPVIPNWYEGYDYIQRGVNPGADSRDAFFLSAGYLPEHGLLDKFTLADDEFLVVYGPNHVATGKATYMNVNVYASEQDSEPVELSIGQVFDDDLDGSAWTYWRGNDTTADLLYAYTFSRDCAGHQPNCMPLSADDYNSDGNTCMIVNDETVLGVISRMYLEPATSVGPAKPEVVYDRVLKFSPRPQD